MNSNQMIRPLSSDEARASLEKARTRKRNAAARGDRAAHDEAHKDESWFAISLEEATERESIEAAEAARAERDAKKPAAREAARLVELPEYFREECELVKSAVEMLVKASLSASPKLAALPAAYKHAKTLCDEACEPFMMPPPEEASANDQFRHVINDVLVHANGLDDAKMTMPTITIAPRKIGWL